MSTPLPPAPRPARPHLDPIDDPATALVTLGPFLARPPRPELLALSLDADRHRTAVVHHAAGGADDIVELAVRVAGTRRPHDVAVVLLSSRPGTEPQPADAERWSVVDDLFHGCGLRLVEWFAFGRVLDLPRRRAGVASRWTT